MSLLQDLFEIKQAGANTQFEELTQSFDDSLSTFYKHKIDSQMLEHRFNQDEIQNERDKKRDALHTFQTVTGRYDNPADLYDYLNTDAAEELAFESGAYRSKENWANYKGDWLDKKTNYEEALSWGNNFRNATSSNWKQTVADYDFHDIQSMKAKADLSGNTSLINSIARHEATWKYNVTKKYGMDSAQAVRKWLYDGNYLSEDQNSQYDTLISDGNSAQAEKQMMNIASTKLKEDSEIMQLYRIEFNVLKELQASNIIDPEQLNQRVLGLDTKYDVHFRGIRQRGLPKGDGDDDIVPVITPGLSNSYQSEDGYSFFQPMSQDDMNALSIATRGLPVNDNDVAALTLPPDSRITADIGFGMKRYEMEVLRKYALDRPGNIKFSGKESDMRKAYSAFAINKSTDKNVTIPKIQLPYWKREAITSGNPASFNEKNIGYKDLQGGQTVVDVRNGKRGDVINMSVGEYDLITAKQSYREGAYAGLGLNIGKLGAQKVYKSKDSKILVRHIYDEGDKINKTIPAGKKVGDDYTIILNYDDFIKRYGAPLYQVSRQSFGDNPNSPYSGIDDPLNLGK